MIERKVSDFNNWFYLADTYGMLWYKKQGVFNGKKIDYLFASGNGGNQLIVVPEKDLVISLTATAYGTRYGHSRAYAILAKLLNGLE